MSVHSLIALSAPGCCPYGPWPPSTLVISYTAVEFFPGLCSLIAETPFFQGALWHLERHLSQEFYGMIPLTWIEQIPPIPLLYYFFPLLVQVYGPMFFFLRSRFDGRLVIPMSCTRVKVCVTAVAV